MKKLLLVLLFRPLLLKAQTNCLIFNDKPHKQACEIYNQAIEYAQGSRASQELFIKSLAICPDYAPSLHEMSVPYLKRGDFYTWKLLMDKAVSADRQMLRDRGWCLFKFLRDYKNAYTDLHQLYLINKKQPGYSGDGDYDLRIIMALCLREMGKYKEAINYFNECIGEHESQQAVGLFDYLHRGVTHLKNKNYRAALSDLLLETKKYAKLADTYYYMGIAYSKLGQKQQAINTLKQARDLFTKTGYTRNDPYCKEPDQIYLSDIDDALKAQTLK